ncbi:hypothetical protein [Rhizobium lentis]|uniref:Uncharacterized protein n=1 Tax=Rhizobium lentis TaxID=1138194 RepID=A0A7W8UKT3_9HYPH|nr:hypothetical protein [Rhizobium lentis]MBB4573336.1 hypothetical protein [Rhizobium lentis]MBB5549265.1 hypothetical protein [Rhizobium lentis]MBB5559799.1 hypothetical protein [Rhizobium lentis]MBB5566318.1 hypothetical protein [Rhizobium lentis]
MRITSRVLVPWGTEQSFVRALGAPAEGIGLTSTDPAFFDDADLADDAGFGNGKAEAITAFQAMLREGLKVEMRFIWRARCNQE